MTAETLRPMMVARGMFRFGFSITPADTAALSTPMNAHRAIEAARIIALVPDPPLTFQLARKVAGWNQNQPSSAIAAMGIRARLMVLVSRAPTTLGPRMFKPVRIQITAAVVNTLAGG